MEAGPRHVPIRSGSVAWLFPALTGGDDVAAVTAALADADDQLARIAESLPLVHVARSEPSARGLVYYRLGPAPYPTTELIFEPWSEEIGILLRLWVPTTPTSTIERVGPSWKAGAWVDVICDVDPTGCRWHTVEERVGPAVASPREAAEEVRAKAAWLAHILRSNSIDDFRTRDPRRGHAVEPRRND